MRKLALILALTTLLLPSLSLAETPNTADPLPETPALSLEEILLGGSCATEASSWVPPGGCSRSCKQDRDCPYYPEQVCIKGCCYF